MAKVLLLTTTPPQHADAYNLAAERALRESAAADHFHQHSLTNDPESADIILFAELFGGGTYFGRVRRHEFVRRFREKCFLFCSNDYVIPLLPGVYASIEKRWSSSRVGGGFYAGAETNRFLQTIPPNDQLPHLFSFVGSTATAPVRRALAQLKHDRSVFIDTSADFERVLHYQMPADERDVYEQRYARIMEQSKFILCPRGVGASSMRLFDTMRIARVPVIVADEWLEPIGPRWSEFSIRVRERDWRDIPDLLGERERDAVAMGRLAREEWERWFAPESAFHHTVEWCLDIKRRRKIPEAIAHWPAYLQFLRPTHLRMMLRLMRARTRSTSSRSTC